MSEQQRFGGEVQTVSETAATPVRPYKTKLASNYLHRLIIALRIVQGEVPNLILDPIGSKNVEYLRRNIVAKVARSQFRDAKN